MLSEETAIICNIQLNMLFTYPKFFLWRYSMVSCTYTFPFHDTKWKPMEKSWKLVQRYDDTTIFVVHFIKKENILNILKVYFYMLPPSHMKVIAPFRCEERSRYLPMTSCSCTCKLTINICLINFIDNWIAKFSHDFKDLGFPCIQCEWAYFTVVNSKTAMNSWTVYKMTNIHVSM